MRTYNPGKNWFSPYNNYYVGHTKIMFVSELMLQSRSNETNAKYQTIVSKNVVF